MNDKVHRKLMNWIVGGETGSSSITLWSAIFECSPQYPSIPHDESDFRRCWNLIMLCDEETKTSALVEVANRYDAWKPYVKHWKCMTDLLVTGQHLELSEALHKLRRW